MLLKFRSFFSAVISVFVLSACVSVVDNGNPRYDRKKALEAYVKLGMNYLQEGDRDRAMRAFIKATEYNSNSAEALHGLAMVHQLNGEYDLAEQRFKQALRGQSAFSKEPIELSYARFLINSERCQEALKLLEKAATDLNYPSRENALYLIGQCSLKVGDIDRAKGAFEHAMNLNPRYAQAALELVDLNLDMRNYERAKSYLDVFSANAAQTPRSLLLGIRIERVFGNKDKEASYVLALKNLHPYSKEYLEYKQLISEN